MIAVLIAVFGLICGFVIGKTCKCMTGYDNMQNNGFVLVKNSMGKYVWVGYKDC